MKILVVDVGGSHVKCLFTGHKTPRKFKSGARMTPDKMVEGVLKITRGWRYTAVSIGHPIPDGTRESSEIDPPVFYMLI